MRYYRIHTADIAYITQQPRGIFTAIGKLVDADILSEEETAEYWKNRAYFEKVLRCLPFMKKAIQTRPSLGLKIHLREIGFILK